MPSTLPHQDSLAQSEQALPPQLHASLQRHRQHLGALVTSLRAAGLAEALIDASVGKLVASYQTELATALHALREETIDA